MLILLFLGDTFEPETPKSHTKYEKTQIFAKFPKKLEQNTTI